MALRRAFCSTARVLRRRSGFLDNWANIVEERVAAWRVLDDGEREPLEETSDSLLRHKHRESGLGEVKVS